VSGESGESGDREWLDEGFAALRDRGRINEDGERIGPLSEETLSRARAAGRRMHITWRWRESELNPGQHPDLAHLRVVDYATTTSEQHYLRLFIDAYLEHQRAQQLG